jgi:methyl-accepting chemotaxis protein
MFDRVHNLKLTHKILAVPIVVTAFLIASAVLGYIGLNEQKQAISSIYSERFKSYKEVGKMLEDVLHIHSQIYKTMSLAQSGFMSPEKLQELSLKLKAVAQQTRGGMDTMIKGDVSAEEKALAKLGVIKLAEYADSAASLIETMTEDAGSAAMLITVVDGKYRGLEQELRKLLELENKLSTRSYNDSRASAERTVQTFSALTLSAVIAAGFLSILIARVTVAPVLRAAGVIQEISRGDFTRRVGATSTCEVGNLCRDIDGMVSSINSIIRGVHGSSDSVAESARVLKTSMQNAAGSARQQAVHADEVMASSSLMHASMTQLAEDASSAALRIDESAKAANRGREIASQAVDRIDKVSRSTGELAEMVNRVNQSAQEIGNIIILIKDIADQTNLLALNAAIEAARAGDAGRGFAVVAQEVRKLAEKTIHATNEISGRIETVQSDSNKTQQTMGTALQQVSSATEYMGEVGRTLVAIADGVAPIRAEIDTIAQGISTRLITFADVSAGIRQTSSLAADIHRATAEAMAETEKLSATSERLVGSVHGYRI